MNFSFPHLKTTIQAEYQLQECEESQNIRLINALIFSAVVLHQQQIVVNKLKEKSISVSIGDYPAFEVLIPYAFVLNRVKQLPNNFQSKFNNQNTYCEVMTHQDQVVILIS